MSVWLHRANSVTAISTNRGDKYVSVTTLATNATKQYTVTGLKAPTNQTTRTLRALVDSRNAIYEIVETNNQTTITYTPVP